MDKAKTKIGVIFTLAVIAVLISVFVLAKPNTTPVPATNDKADVPVIIPAHAVEVADNVFSLGTAQDVDGRIVEGFMFIDKKKGNANPNAVCGNGVCDGGEKKSCPADCSVGGGGTGTSTCFSLLAKGARWKTTEPYSTGSGTNITGIDATLTETSLETWDSEIPSFNIFGARNISGTTDGADDVSPDGKNEVEFANLGDGDTIAVTITWGIFIGPPSGRELVEWDATFNTAYPFGNYIPGDPTMMDYQNIATHEFGHALGLAHPDDTCTEETMYRFAGFNETKKRDLNTGDIAGINSLY